MSESTTIQNPIAEDRHADELAFLGRQDPGPRPTGWSMTPANVVTFICGSEDALSLPAEVKVPKGLARRMTISPKFIGPRSLIERCVVTLAGERGLLLAGEPGTAKSMLSELLAAAISGTSTLTVQGTAGTTEEQLRYGWNYALLLAKGPCLEALTPSPVLQAMQTGRIARIEEITRCLPEVQDAMVSILSERRITVPDLADASGQFPASGGFNIIATANLRDKGVSEMSAALKRRFNFEIVEPIDAFSDEVALVEREARQRIPDAGDHLDRGLVETLVTVFRDLRRGISEEGWQITKPSSIMSTAECVTVATAIARQAMFFPSQKDPLSGLPGHLLGAALKDNAEDATVLLGYWDHAVKQRAESDQPLWRRLYDLRRELDGHG